MNPMKLCIQCFWIGQESVSSSGWSPNLRYCNVYIACEQAKYAPIPVLYRFFFIELIVLKLQFMNDPVQLIQSWPWLVIVLTNRDQLFVFLWIFFIILSCYWLLFPSILFAKDGSSCCWNLLMQCWNLICLYILIKLLHLFRVVVGWQLLQLLLYYWYISHVLITI
jgi:hypothetical protein